MKFTKYQKLTLYLIILAALIRFAILPLTSISGDGCWHANVARFIGDNGKIPLFEGLGRPVFWAPPLFHIISGFLYAVIGSFGLKLLPAIAGVLSLLFVFLIAKELFDEKTGFLATLFVAFLPNHIYLSTIAYVDTTLGLFVTASIYFALKNRVILAGLFSGLAMLTKYHALFGVFVVLFIIYLNNKERIKNLLHYTAVSIIVGIWWYLRNWAKLGNPVWDFLNNFFKGFVFEKAARSPTLLNFLSPNYLAVFYLSLFGIPPGTFEAVLRLGTGIPFFTILIRIWFIATLFYIAPLFFGFKNIKWTEKRWKIMAAWSVSFIIFAFLYIYDAQSLYARFFIPVLPVCGILWARGVLRLNKIVKKENIKKILAVVFILVVIGFIAVEFGKAEISSRQWDIYSHDFGAVQKEMPSDSVVLTAQSQCVAYYLYKETVFYSEDVFSEIKKGTSDIDYVFVDDLKTRKTSRLFPDEFGRYLDNKPKVYENTETGICIYKLR